MSHNHDKTREVKQLRKELKEVKAREAIFRAIAEAAGERCAIMDGSLPKGSDWGEAKHRRERIEERIKQLGGKL